MNDISKRGEFYLGKLFDPKGNLTDLPFLYPSKDLTTHAVCVGMTGSGKTGFGIVLLEEAALDGIPAIIIDPKGDMGDLLLTFPDLKPDDFLPWIDPTEAANKGMDIKDYAKELADKWKTNLAKSGQTQKRIQELRNSVDMVIYTPASKAGISISILGSFAPPPKEVMLDSAALRERIQTTTSSLLGLLGIDADPIKSREHILISTLIDQAWQKGEEIGLAQLIQQIQKPPFTKVGVLDLETFFPTKERIALSVTLNNLLASPGFQAWLEGEPLDMQKLLYTDKGKPKLAIISIAHLTDPERMFIVTLILNELLGWVRRQSGTSSLRSLLYMDEIFGYFPPTSNPPSKLPMLTLLKQARAFGLGIVLSTQNPVDLDYKGLANCGTWIIGKLQTERDKERLIDGLQVGSRAEFNALITSTGSQKFVCNSIYLKEPFLFQTRWAMSYLKGPLTLVQISELTDHKAEPVSNVQKAGSTSSTQKPVLQPGIGEYYLNLTSYNGPVVYKPFLFATAKLHFANSKYKIDEWQDLNIVAPFTTDGQDIAWGQSEVIPDIQKNLSNDPQSNATFEDLPGLIQHQKVIATIQKQFSSYLYQDKNFTVYEFPELNTFSQPNETEAAFRLRMEELLQSKNKEKVDVLKKKYEDKISALAEKIRKQEMGLEEEKSQTFWQKIEAYFSMFMTLLGAFFSRKKLSKTTINQTGTSLRRVGRLGKNDQEVANKEENLKAYQQQLEDLQVERDTEIARLSVKEIPESAIQKVTISPKKSDIAIDRISLLWRSFPLK